MTIRTLAAAVALSLTPVIAFAAGCNYERQVMSCADGTVYDSEAGKCVVSVNS